MRAPRIILLNDPTRGIDVGTKQELYQLLRRLADAGAAILFYSTDYDELIGCCDRVLVLYDGAHQARAGRAGNHRARADRGALNIKGGEAGVRRGRCIERVALPAGRAARDAAGVRHLPADVRHLRLQPSRRADGERRADRRQQGRAARLRRHGADAGGDHRRHRPFGRHDLHPHQLPGVVAGGRQGGRDDVRRHRGASDRGRLRRAQRRDRDLRTVAADRRDDRHRRRLFRPGAAACGRFRAAR